MPLPSYSIVQSRSLPALQPSGQQIGFGFRRGFSLVHIALVVVPGDFRMFQSSPYSVSGGFRWFQDVSGGFQGRRFIIILISTMPVQNRLSRHKKTLRMSKRGFESHRSKMYRSAGGPRAPAPHGRIAQGAWRRGVRRCSVASPGATTAGAAVLLAPGGGGIPLPGPLSFLNIWIIPAAPSHGQ